MLVTERILKDEILDALDSGLLILDQEAKVVVWNEWMASATGIPAADAGGRALVDLFPGRNLGRLTSAVRDALELGASSLLTHVLHPEMLPLRTRADQELVHDIAVRPVGAKPDNRCLIQIADVTVSAERERVLRQRQNARYDAVVESAPDPILTLDADGLIQFANPAAAREFGYSPQDLRGRSLETLLEAPDGWKAAWSATVRGEPVDRRAGGLHRGGVVLQHHVAQFDGAVVHAAAEVDRIALLDAVDLVDCTEAGVDPRDAVHADHGQCQQQCDQQAKGERQALADGEGVGCP